MPRPLPLRGTLLNTLTVIVGSVIGLLAQSILDPRWQEIAITGIGIVTCVLGIKMALGSKNILIVVGSICLGGILGAMLGIDHGLQNFAEWARSQIGGGGSFNEGLLTASILYCVGPMTILGCLQDGLEGKIELLAIKSTLDGVASIFLAATLGIGVLVSAAVVFVVQGLITLLARPLAPIAKREGVIDEASATGGIMLIAVGLGLLGIKDVATELFLPALILAPIATILAARGKSVSGEAQVP